MAKKRSRTKTKVKTRKISALPRQKGMNMMNIAYILALIGSIFVLVYSAILALGLTVLSFFVGGVAAILAVPGIICGLLMLIATGNLKKKPKSSAILLLVVSIIALIPAHLGGVLGIIAAILVLVETNK